jgi:hypothetical protein
VKGKSAIDRSYSTTICDSLLSELEIKIVGLFIVKIWKGWDRGLSSNQGEDE